MGLFLQNTTLLTPGERIEAAAISIQDGIVARVGSQAGITPAQGDEILDASGLLVVPGLIDLQINGAFGEDFTQDPGCIWRVGAQLVRYGVTAFLPTIITSPLEAVARAQAVIQQGPPPGYQGARPLGLHLEGPFLNLQKKGAHPPAWLRLPDLPAIENWTPQQGVRLVTLAPELPQALALVRSLCQRGIVVSAGHSMATFDQAQQALQAGIGWGTHLFNAMPSLGHREPGLAGALMTAGTVPVGLICDGLHIHPALVAVAWRAKQPHGLILVTDAMAALGMPPGRYRLGDMDVLVDGNSARLADGTLAGSLLTLPQAVRNLVDFTGCSLEEALATATRLPADLLGETRLGRVAPGCTADLTLLTSDLQVAATIVGGQVIYRKER